MNIKEHKLKTDPEVFEQSWQEIKPYEIRIDDRNFQVGDELLLLETKYNILAMASGVPLEYTGRVIKQKIISKLKDCYGLKDGWCILGVKTISKGFNRDYLGDD